MNLSINPDYKSEGDGKTYMYDWQPKDISK
jgi:hypothetical protein